MDAKFKNLKTADDLSILNGHAFEEYLTQLFGDLGYRAEKTPGSGDFGADLVLTDQAKKIVVQAKQYVSDVGFDAVKEIHFAKAFYDADEAWVVCTGKFTKQAVEAAEAVDVRLVDGKTLQKLIGKAHKGEFVAGSPFDARRFDPENFNGPEGNLAAGFAFEELWDDPTFKAADVSKTLGVSIAKACAICKCMGWGFVPTTEKVTVFAANWANRDSCGADYLEFNVALGKEFEKIWKERSFKAADIANTLGVSIAKASTICRAMQWEKASSSGLISVYSANWVIGGK